MPNPPHLQPGDHLRISRGPYDHHALYEGNGSVVHFAVPRGRKRWASIRRDPLWKVARGATVEVVEYAHRYSPEDTLRRAWSRLDEVGYHVARNNCESFCRWACTGEARSQQVERARASAAGGAGTVALAKGGTGLVAAGGVVAGRSGAGLMSGLAGVGGRAAVGLGVLGAVPAAASVATVHRVLRDDPALVEHERSARRAGRNTATATAIVAPLAVRGVVHALGTGAGAVRLASGLRVLGALAGGGMASGIAVAIAVPALLTLGIGWLAYRARGRGGRR